MVYPEHVTNCLKQTLLQRKDNGYFFTAADIAFLVERTQLPKAHVEKWAKNARFKNPGDKLVLFLKTLKKDKVFYFYEKFTFQEKSEGGAASLQRIGRGALSLQRIGMVF